MKKISFFILLLFICFNNLNAQDIFKIKSYAEALQKSNETGKLILIQLETSENCDQCNYLGNNIFKNKEVFQIVNENFIIFYLAKGNKDRTQVNNDLKINDEYFGTIFIDATKNIVNKFGGTTSNPKTYLELFDKVLNQSNENLKLNVIKDIYNKSNSITDLQTYITVSAKSDEPIDSLLNIYALKYYKDSTNSINKLTFIIKNAPALESIASKTVFSNKNFNAIWYQMPLNERIQINNKIISKTLANAVKQKNELLAIRTTNFIRAVNEKPYSYNTNRIVNYHLKNYYKEVNDTSKYFSYAIKYIDTFLMTVSPDSIKNADINNQKKLLVENTQNAKFSDTIINGVPKKILGRTYNYTPKTQFYTKELNEEAWNFYTKTNDKNLLEKALQWSIRANQFYESYESLDTYARLLYKLGNKTEAIKQMEYSLKLQTKLMPNLISKNKEVLIAMKKGLNKIDEY